MNSEEILKPETIQTINKHNTQLIIMQKDIKLILAKLKVIEKSMDCKAEKKDVDKLKDSVEKLKKFKWQLVTGILVVLWVLDRFGDKFF